MLRLSPTTGVISGSLKWSVPYVTRTGRTRTKTVSGKAGGVVIDDVGVGTVTVKLDGETESYEFTAVPTVYVPGTDYSFTGYVRCIPGRPCPR